MTMFCKSTGATLNYGDASDGCCLSRCEVWKFIGMLAWNALRHRYTYIKTWGPGLG